MEEPTETKCEVMLRGVVPALEKHHSVRILDEGAERGGQALAPLSARPAASRQGGQRARYRLRAAVALRQNATPPAVEDAIREIDDCAVQIARAGARGRAGRGPRRAPGGHGQRRRPPRKRAWRSSQARWEKERDLVGQIREMRAKLEGTAAPRSRPAAAPRPPPPRQPDPAAQPRRPPNPPRARAAGSTTRPARRTGHPQRRAGSAAGRNAADAGLRGRAHRGRRGLRLDRHSHRQDAEGRSGDRAPRSNTTWAGASSARTMRWR